MLNKVQFTEVVEYFGLPDIDLFASRLNAQLPRYITWQPDPSAENVDAFTVDWGPLWFYAFPPFCLIPKCLQKIRADKATGLLVVPNWPTQSWFPALQDMLTEKPLVLCRHAQLLVQPVSFMPHPLHKHLDLLCCRLSANPSGRRD